MKPIFKKSILPFLLLASAAFPSCNYFGEGKAAGDDHKETAEGAHAGKEGGEHGHEEEALIALSDFQFRNAGIKLGKMLKRKIGQGVKANGHLTVPPQNMADVSSFTEGIVHSIDVFETGKVSKGQVLATLVHPDFIKLQEDYLVMLSEIGYLEKDFERQKGLSEDNTNSKKVLEKIESEYFKAKAQLVSIESQLKLLSVSTDDLKKGKIEQFINIKAPIGGLITKIEANIGEYIKLGTPIFEIVNNEHIHVHLQVYEKHFSKVKIGQTVSFTLPNLGNTVYEGFVRGVGNTLEGEEKYLTVHVEVKHDKDYGLVPGMYVEALIQTGDEESLSIQESALVSYENMFYVFVLHAKEANKYEFEMLPVSVGERALGIAAIKPLSEELTEDKEIVLEGSFFIMSQKVVSEGGGGHGH